MQSIALALLIPIRTRERSTLQQPLHAAVSNDNFELARKVLQHGAEVNSPDDCGRTPLCSMVLGSSPRSEGSRVTISQLLLEYGADVNSRDEEDTTALHDASYLQDLEVVWTPLDHGAYVNVEDNRGRTPLHRGLRGHKNEACFGIAKLLVKYGADVNARDKYHEPALHLASCGCEPSY